MTFKEDAPLPEKCCAKCGFLYGMARSPASREDATFDPDIIRLTSYPPQPIPNETARGIIASLPYVHLSQGVVSSDEQSTTIRRHSWASTQYISCHKMKFRPLKVDAMYRRRQQSGDEILNYIPISTDNILQTIRTDRRDCDGFYDYYPGFTPAQHTTLQIESLREQRSQDHERRIAEWSNSQESRWRRYEDQREKEQTSAENNWRARDRSLLIKLTLIGFFFTVIQIAADVVIALLKSP